MRSLLALVALPAIAGCASELDVVTSIRARTIRVASPSDRDRLVGSTKAVPPGWVLRAVLARDLADRALRSGAGIRVEITGETFDAALAEDSNFFTTRSLAIEFGGYPPAPRPLAPGTRARVEISLQVVPCPPGPNERPGVVLAQARASVTCEIGDREAIGIALAFARSGAGWLEKRVLEAAGATGIPLAEDGDGGGRS